MANPQLRKHNDNELPQTLFMFARIACHELRNPLGIVQLLAELSLEAEKRSLPSSANGMKKICTMTAQMAETLDDMLYITRLYSGNSVWRWGEVELSRAVNAALSIRPIEKDGVTISVRQPDELLPFRGDEEAVTRLIHSLAFRALKLTARGEIAVACTEEIDPAGRWVRISVSGGGDAISPAVLGWLGEPVESNIEQVMDSVAKHELGLAVCRSIATAHGGEISGENLDGGGSVIVARLRADRGGSNHS